MSSTTPAPCSPAGWAACPTDAEVAEAAGVTVDEVTANADDVSRASVMSLQGFGDTSIDDVLPTRAPSPEEKVEQNERIGYLVDSVALLPERLRVVVEGYFFAERPMAEIADELGVTESRVSQMRAEALVLLKDAMNSALDPELVAPHARPDGCAARRRDAYFAAVASRRTAAARLQHGRRACRPRLDRDRLRNPSGQLPTTPI